MKPQNTLKYSLIAPCGMDCALCHAYQRAEDRCGGCRSDDVKGYCHRCAIRDCRKKKRFCYECDSVCKRLSQLDRRYRKNYGMSMLENLDFIRNNGLRRFVKKEKERWKCRHSGNLICIHKKVCLRCQG